MKLLEKLSVLVILPFLLMSCASAVLESYVGKTLIDPVLDHGPPVGTFDLGDGRRAFVWQKNVSGSIPGNSSTRGNVNVYGNTAIYSSTTYTTAPTNYNYQCYYTLIAMRTSGDIEGPSAWTVTEFRKPSLACE